MCKMMLFCFFWSIKKHNLYFLYILLFLGDIDIHEVTGPEQFQWVGGF